MAVADVREQGGDNPSSGPPKVAALNNPAVRATIFQVILAIIVLLVVWQGIANMNANLQAAGVSSGFGFWDDNAGFSVNQSLIAFDQGTATYGRIYVIGVLNTLLVAFFGILLATALGFVIGIARLSTNWIVNRLALGYVEFFRNIPLLLHIFIWYFGVLRLLPQPRDSIDLGFFGLLSNRGMFAPKPLWENLAIWTPIALVIGIVAAVLVSRWAHKRQMATGKRFNVLAFTLAAVIGFPVLVFLLTGLPVTFDRPEMGGFRPTGGMTVIPEFIALFVALGTYTAAFIAEIVRAGILGVSKGQSEAAHALGLRQGQNLRLVVIPQALRIIIPPLTSQYLNLTKNSSLAVAIAYPELTSVFAGTALNQTGQAVEIISITMLTYLTISLATSAFMNWYNNSVALVER